MSPSCMTSNQVNFYQNKCLPVHIYILWPYLSSVMFNDIITDVHGMFKQVIHTTALLMQIAQTPMLLFVLHEKMYNSYFVQYYNCEYLFLFYAYVY